MELQPDSQPPAAVPQRLPPNGALGKAFPALPVKRYHWQRSRQFAWSASQPAQPQRACKPAAAAGHQQGQLPAESAGHSPLLRVGCKALPASVAPSIFRDKNRRRIGKSQSKQQVAGRSGRRTRQAPARVRGVAVCATAHADAAPAVVVPERVVGPGARADELAAALALPARRAAAHRAASAVAARAALHPDAAGVGAHRPHVRCGAAALAPTRRAGAVASTTATPCRSLAAPYAAAAEAG
jgi:hypothetical protein